MYSAKGKKNNDHYKKLIPPLAKVRYRNIMDMNAGLGSFAAVLESPKLWVLNVFPFIADTSTLGVIYERGLIGMYHDWYVNCRIGLLVSYFGYRNLFLTYVRCTLFLHFGSFVFCDRPFYFCWFPMWGTSL